MEAQKEFICVCGKIFTESQKFNGHKSHCKIHQIQKYGNLDTYYNRQQQNQAKMINCLKNKRKNQQEQKRLEKQKELNIWLIEQHKCRTCGKIMTTYYGSGIYIVQKNVRIAEFYQMKLKRK